MKKIIFSTISIIFFTLFMSSAVFAQGMTGNKMMGENNAITQSGDGHTAREEAEGKAIWEKLQAKQLECKNLTNDNFEALGEYFMGQMAGGSHEAMNNMMVRMMNEEGEKQMHIAMGKRNSGCDTSASGAGIMPMMGMMQMMGGGENPMMGTGFGNMMGGWGGFGALGWLSMLLFWILLILGVIALIRYLSGSGKRSAEGKSPLDILKERYARGEIDKKEFEEKKKGLS